MIQSQNKHVFSIIDKKAFNHNCFSWSSKIFATKKTLLLWLSVLQTRHTFSNMHANINFAKCLSKQLAVCKHKAFKIYESKFSGAKLPLRIALSVLLSFNNFIISLLCVYIAPRTYSLEPPFRHHTCSLHRICTPFCTWRIPHILLIMTLLFII